MQKVTFGESIGVDLSAGVRTAGKTFHGSGMPVESGARLFCASCLKKGHQCLAREGSDECIFCEDGAPCPAMRRQASAHTRIRPTSAEPRLVGEAHPTRGRYGEKLKKAPLKPNADGRRNGTPEGVPLQGGERAPSPMRVTVHAEKPREFVKSTAGKELIRAAVKEVSMKAETTRTCSVPDCGNPLMATNESGRCHKHWYVPKNGTRRAGGGAGENKVAA